MVDKMEMGHIRAEFLEKRLELSLCLEIPYHLERKFHFSEEGIMVLGIIIFRSSNEKSTPRCREVVRMLHGEKGDRMAAFLEGAGRVKVGFGPAISLIMKFVHEKDLHRLGFSCEKMGRKHSKLLYPFGSKWVSKGVLDTGDRSFI